MILAQLLSTRYFPYVSLYVHIVKNMFFLSDSSLAPYKSVTKHIEKAAGGDELLLSCQSEGYPESPVMWQDGHLKTLNPNTTAVTTPQQLVKVTSQIRVGSSAKNNYTCIFTKDGSSATFQIPGTFWFPFQGFLVTQNSINWMEII